jgi:hypothetical protein
LSAAKNAAFSTKNSEIGPEVAKIMEAWATLPDHIRMAILALVETAKSVGAWRPANLPA